MIMKNHSGEVNLSATVLLCTSNERLEKWIKVLCTKFSYVYAIPSDDKYYYNCETGTGKEIEKTNDFPCKMDAVFLHDSDVLPAWLKEIHAKKCFLFTSYGDTDYGKTDNDDPTQVDIQTDNIYKIYRNTTKEGFDIKNKDIGEIAAYVNGKLSELPSCCMPPVLMAYLPTFIILCQAYLAAHFPKSSETFASPIQAQAFDKMGQTKLIKKGSGKESEQPEWWQSVLGKKKNVLLKKLTDEWGNKELPSC